MVMCRRGITSYIYWLWIVSSGWSSVSTVLGQMTYPVTILTLDRARSYVMQGASFTQGIVSSIPIGGNISPGAFLPSILLLVVIMVAVVIVVVTVILVVKVVIAIIGVVVVVGDVFIIKLSFVIIGVLCRIMFYYLIHQPLGYVDSFLKSLSSRTILICQESFQFGPGDLVGLLYPNSSLKPANESNSSFHTVEVERLTANELFIVSSFCYKSFSWFKSSGDIVDLIGDEDPTDEDGDTKVSVSLEGDYERLWYELYRLETSMEDVEGVCGAAACMEQKGKMVLVTNPHIKTPYELLLSRTPSIGLMRPFGCLVIILNTLDPLGSGPTWLFDVDTLTQSMNYQPVVAGNQPNSSVGFQEHFNAVKEPESEVHVSPSSSAKTKKHDDKTKREAKERVLSNMPALEDITYSDDEEDVGVEADFSNLETHITEELLQFKMQKVWALVDLPKGKRAIEEVYVCQPPRFEDPDYPDKVYKVVKALYRLHQALRAWQKGDILLVQLYVDDIIFRSTNKDLCKAFEKLMKDKFQISSMGELTFFLGLQLKQKNDGIFISQDKYVAKILKKFNLTNGKSASTPIDTENPLLKDPDGEDVDTVVATLSTEPEYVAAVSCCAQVLWIQNQLLDYGLIFNAISSKLLLFGLTIDVVRLMLLVADDVDVTDDVVVADAEPTPLSPTPATTPPPQQVVPIPPPSPHQSPISQPSLPPQQQHSPPSQTTNISMDLLNTLLETCTTLTRRLENLEQDKIDQALEITKLKQRVRRFEKRNKGRIIAKIDADEDVTLEEVDAEKDVEVAKNTAVSGRLEEFQA
uniref:Reverse transcriptase Ty1/copia-type domain-containing protein n=1 Tax=Tanacetum cinerariifolium TaxID=118510 RepID=A0A6L2MRE6_TANCI|nr:hypothetical protein [Tanacetum cinerariifolium]